MKKLKEKVVLMIFLLFMTNLCLAQKDSLKLKSLEDRIQIIEGFKENTKEGLKIDFTKLETKLNRDYSHLETCGYVFGSLSLVLIIGACWKGKAYVDEKIKEKFDKIITEYENHILEVIRKEDIEQKLILKKKILVLTAKNGDDAYLRKFFKAMKFSIDNVNYEKVDTYKVYDNYDLIFINNEAGDFDENLTETYFKESNSTSVLFYFGSNTKVTPEQKNRMGFANSKPQIYGNLINLLKYQDILK